MANNNFAGPCLYGLDTDEQFPDSSTDFNNDDYFKVFIDTPSFTLITKNNSYEAEGYLNIAVQLKCSEIYELIKSNDAGIFIRFISSRSKFREAFELTNEISNSSTENILNKTFRVDVPVRNLWGNIDLSVAIVAKRNTTLSHKDIDGEDISIKITKGRILGYYKLRGIFEIAREGIPNDLSSLFVIVKAKADPPFDNTFNVELQNSDTITITLYVGENDNSFQSEVFRLAESDAELSSISSLIVLPALASLLSQLYELKEDGRNEYKTCLWYQKIAGTLLENNLDIENRDVSDALDDAQLLLRKPTPNYLLEEEYD